MFEVKKLDLDLLTAIALFSDNFTYICTLMKQCM